MDQIKNCEQCTTHFFYILQIIFLLMNNLDKQQNILFSAVLPTLSRFYSVINILNCLMSCLTNLVRTAALPTG